MGTARVLGSRGQRLSPCKSGFGPFWHTVGLQGSSVEGERREGWGVNGRMAG